MQNAGSQKGVSTREIADHDASHTSPRELQKAIMFHHGKTSRYIQQANKRGIKSRFADWRFKLSSQTAVKRAVDA